MSDNIFSLDGQATAQKQRAAEALYITEDRILNHPEFVEHRAVYSKICRINQRLSDTIASALGWMGDAINVDELLELLNDAYRFAVEINKSYPPSRLLDYLLMLRFLQYSTHGVYLRNSKLLTRKYIELEVACFRHCFVPNAYGTKLVQTALVDFMDACHALVAEAKLQGKSTNIPLEFTKNLHTLHDILVEDVISVAPYAVTFRYYEVSDLRTLLEQYCQVCLLCGGLDPASQITGFFGRSLKNLLHVYLLPVAPESVTTTEQVIEWLYGQYPF